MTVLTKRKVTIALLAALGWLLKINKDKYGWNVGAAWLFKRALGLVLSRVMTIPIPRLISGKGSVAKVGITMKDFKCTKVLIVSDEILVKVGIVEKCQKALTEAGVKSEVFDKVMPNPHVEVVEAGFAMYKEAGCDGIVAVGGGSPMDVAKVIGAKVANPRQIQSYQGFFQVNMLGFRPLPPLVAIPTTAGTGSETTVAAVITDKAAGRKLAIADLGLVPLAAVLDPEMVTKCPKPVTAATGMDALTHAVESYISGWASDFTRRKSLDAAGKIFKFLEVSYKDGENAEAREAMLNAAYSAGLAFTRANIGYVHAVAHQFGGMFNTPHGDANAMLLPHVLRWYIAGEREGDANGCVDRYCELAVAGELAPCVPTGWSDRLALAETLISRIAAMNAAMNIPTEVKDMKASQVAQVAVRALNEAHGSSNSVCTNFLGWALDLGYPVPKYMELPACERIIANLLPSSEKAAWEQQHRS